MGSIQLERKKISSELKDIAISLILHCAVLKEPLNGSVQFFSDFNTKDFNLNQRKKAFPTLNVSIFFNFYKVYQLLLIKKNASNFRFLKCTLNVTPDKSSRLPTLVLNDGGLLAKVMALLKQNCGIAGRFFIHHIWLAPRCVTHVSICNTHFGISVCVCVCDILGV